MRMNLTLLAVCGLFLSVLGCGSGVKPTPHLTLVGGKVTSKDKKITAEHCELQFHPKSGESNGQKIFSVIIEDTYSIRTEAPDGQTVTGAPEGDYVVTLSPPPPGGQLPNTPKAPPAPLTFPAKYRDPKTSDLTAHVGAHSDTITTIDFELAK